MPMTELCGAILAGGQARRMGGANKALIPLAGRPMLQHVIDRLAPQANPLLLAVDRNDPALNPFGLEQVSDPLPGHQGPLGGVLSALRHAARWLLLAPCDAPFLPLNLGAELASRAASSGALLVTAAWQGHWQPTFSLWHRDLAQRLEEAVLSRHIGGLRQFMHEQQAEVLDWPVASPANGPEPFYNVNDRAALQRAEAWLGQEENAC
jgi:molybdopterin-guanine dinucleotide biosynthesis protein A